jgi:dTDP-4-dehydrorhamnose reductase
MKILLLGKDGQVGWELQRSLSPLGEVIAMGRQEADFEDAAGLAVCIRRHAPSVIVNAAAYTAVDKAESEQERARAINALAPGMLAQEALSLGAWLVHYSTDYVFDGSGEHPWRETDATGPLNVYGATKLEGERLIHESGCKHLIFRTSWVYGTRGGNFAKTMLRLAKERDSLSVIDDQIGAPTGADLLADTTAHVIRTVLQRPELSGLYHLAAAGETSWCNYARFVLELAQARGAALKAGPGQVKPISTGDYPTPARRPGNSRLDTSKFTKAFDLHLPDWHYHVRRLIDELIPQGAS